MPLKSGKLLPTTFVNAVISSADNAALKPEILLPSHLNQPFASMPAIFPLLPKYAITEPIGNALPLPAGAIEYSLSKRTDP